MASIFSFGGHGFTNECFERGVKKLQCFVVNIYSPCSLGRKRKLLWEDLRRAKSRLGNGWWCLVELLMR